jgi:hypothetical protein
MPCHAMPYTTYRPLTLRLLSWVRVRCACSRTTGLCPVGNCMTSRLGTAPVSLSSRRGGTLVGIPDVAGRAKCEKAISRQFAVRFGPRTGESQRSRTSHQRSGPVHSFDPSLSASTTTTALFPRRAHERPLHQYSTDPITLLCPRPHTITITTTTPNSIALGRPTASHPTPPLCHASITHQSGPLATVAAAVASIVLCYLPARYTASQRCPIRRPACLLLEIHISSP